MTAMYTVQLLEEQHNGYEDWQTYAVRDPHNHCVCIVGGVDHATAATNHETALRIARALDECEREACPAFTGCGSSDCSECGYVDWPGEFVAAGPAIDGGTVAQLSEVGES